MKKLVLLCTMLATLACLAYAEYQVNAPGYETAKVRYYELMDRVVNGTATQTEAAEFSDLCQVYGFDVPVTEPVEERGGDNLDQGAPDCTTPTVIPGCPYADTGLFDGDNDCTAPSGTGTLASPYNDVFYEFTPTFTGRIQMRARSYTTGVAAIRVVSGNCCTGAGLWYSASSVQNDCKNPIAAGLEPSTVVTYLYAEVTQGVTYWIHVGTSSSTASTAAYEFNLWCIPCPTMEPDQVHNTCPTAWEIACNDSIMGDSAYSSVPATHDWYKIVVPDYSPMACSLRVFVGGREMGHCISGRYPAYTGVYPYSVDGKFTLYKERAGQTCVYDSIAYGYDDGCNYDALRTVAVDPGTYYIKVWNDNYYDYVLVTTCIEYNPMAACCFLDASCQDMGASACAALGGWSKPIGVLCATNPCPTSPCQYESKDTEPNNTCDPSREEVFCDNWYCGVIAPAADVDWYKLVVAEGVCESLVVDIFGNATPSQWPYLQGLNPYVYLYAADCVTQLAYNDNNSGVDPDPVGNDSRLKKAVGPGTYYIKVTSSSSLTSGPYVMHITCYPRECLPGDFCSNAISIPGLPWEDAGKTTCGFIDDYRPTCMSGYANGPDVIYTIELDGNTCFGCSLFTTAGSYGSVSLYANCPTNAAEPCIAKSVGAYSGPYGFRCQGAEGALPAGRYYIMVDNSPSPVCITSYTLRVFQCDCPTPCPYPNRDDELVNNTCGTSDPVVACGDTLCGLITTSADADWYQITIPTGECKSVVAKVYADDTPNMWPFGQGLDPTVALYASNCPTSYLVYNDDNNGVFPEPVHYDSKITSGCLMGGTYYIKVAGLSAGPYVLVVQCVACECPDLTGDVCASARVIGALPYYNVGSTCTYFANDYSATCLGSYDDGPDVVYRFEVTTETCATCSLTNVTASAYPGLGIFDGCPDVGICMTYASASTGSIGTSCVVFEPGHVYYIMVDNWPSPACITAYTLEVEPCECPHPCEWYTLCGTPGEVEVNNTCPPPVEQAEITCDMSVYGLHCPMTDTDFWKVTVPPMSIMTLQLYSGPNCTVTPAAGVLFRYYDDQCLLPTTGTTSPLIISNTTATPLVKYLEVYDNGQSVTLYKVTATCCQIRNYCADPIYTGTGIPAWSYDSTVNTCCATDVVDTVGSTGCATGSRYVSGPDVVFKFILSSTNIVSISVNSVGSGDGQFSLFTDCANPKTSCIMSQDATMGTTPEVANNLVLPAGTYYVSVSDFGATACGVMHIHITSDCPLPVELLGDVVAAPGSEKVTLTWATASETNSDRFEIVRNGRMIGRVSAAGTSPSRHDYSWSEEGLNNGQTYTYTLRSVDINGRVIDLATVSATPSFAAGEVTEYALHQNYPNPFNPVTTIAFDLLEAGNVNLKIFNLMGQEVRTVVSGTMPKGRHTVSFDAGDLASGVYLYRIEVNGFAAEKKMLLMK